MREQYERTELLLGSAAMDRLRKARVAVFGIGGVGGYVVEALARSGVGALDLIDDDMVSLSNINRQIIANHTTIGMAKVDAAEQRIHDIDPEISVNKWKTFFLPQTKNLFDFKVYDYVVDAVDTVTAKLCLAECAKEAGTRLIASMGAGNKLDASRFEIADISETSVCPLARVMRKELGKRGIDHLKVIYSKEKPMTPVGSSSIEKEAAHKRRATPGSVAFVPAVAGLILAGEVIRDLTEDVRTKDYNK